MSNRDRTIPGKIIERKRCSNPNCKSANLETTKSPNNRELGEKYCNDCFTTQTWGVFTFDEPFKDFVPLTKEDAPQLSPAELQRRNKARWWEQMRIIGDDEK